MEGKNPRPVKLPDLAAGRDLSDYEGYEFLHELDARRLAKDPSRFIDQFARGDQSLGDLKATQLADRR